MPTLPTGLVRDKSSGVYYLRRRIPSDILSCYPGKTERIFSLKTKDFRTALQLHRQAEAKLTAEWDVKRKKIQQFHARMHPEPLNKIDVLTPEIIDSICGRFEISSLTSDDIMRDEKQYTAEDIDKYKAGYSGANSDLRTAVSSKLWTGYYVRNTRRLKIEIYKDICLAERIIAMHLLQTAKNRR